MIAERMMTKASVKRCVCKREKRRKRTEERRGEGRRDRG